MRKLFMLVVILFVFFAGCEKEQTLKNMPQTMENYALEIGKKAVDIKANAEYFIKNEHMDILPESYVQSNTEYMWVVSPNVYSYGSISKLQKNNQYPIKSLKLDKEKINAFYFDDTQKQIYLVTEGDSNKEWKVKILNYELQQLKSISIQLPIIEIDVFQNEIYAVSTKGEQDLYFVKLTMSGEVLHEEKIRQGALISFKLAGNKAIIGTTNAKMTNNEVCIYNLDTLQKQVLNLGDFVPWFCKNTNEQTVVYSEKYEHKEGKILYVNTKNQVAKEVTIQYDKDTRYCSNVFQYKDWTIFLYNSLMNTKTMEEDEAIYVYGLKAGNFINLAAYELQGEDGNILMQKSSYLDQDNLVFRTWNHETIYDFAINLDDILP